MITNVMPRIRIALVLAALVSSFAQAQSRLPQPTETLIVLGSATPMPLGESPRSVESLSVAAESLTRS